MYDKASVNWDSGRIGSEFKKYLKELNILKVTMGTVDIDVGDRPEEARHAQTNELRNVCQFRNKAWSV